MGRSLWEKCIRRNCSHSTWHINQRCCTILCRDTLEDCRSVFCGPDFQTGGFMWQWHHLEPQCLLIKKELIERIFVLYKSNTGSCFCHKKYFASSLKRIEPSITDRKTFCTDKESNIVDAFTQEFPSALSIQYFRHFKKAIERKLKN